jgi:hypothetical protein
LFFGFLVLSLELEEFNPFGQLVGRHPDEHLLDGALENFAG